DGICMNQGDKEECTQQVLLMTAIYSQASQVLCWLGDGEGGHAAHTFGLARRVWSKLMPSRDNDGSRKNSLTEWAICYPPAPGKKLPPSIPSEVAGFPSWLTTYFLNSEDHQIDSEL
ncbi:hypothetical protein B0T18DRAFT_330176, partial [Schizothecium vesticola]